MFPHITDNVVNIKDNVQILDDLSKIIFLIVGRTLLDKNSLTYKRMIFFLVFILFVYLFIIKFISTRLHFIAWSESLGHRPLAEPTLPH